MTLFQPDPSPIFSPEERRYHYFESCASARQDGSQVIFEGVLESGEILPFAITAITPTVIRVRYHAHGRSLEHETPYTVENKFHPPAIRMGEDKESYRIDTGSIIVRLNKSPWQMSVCDAGGDTIFRQEIWDKGVVFPVTFPTGYSEDEDQSRSVHENISLTPDEHLFGLGPKYMSVNKRGRRAVMWCSETICTTTTDLSYMSVPFFMSSRGYGLFLNHGSKSIFELGSHSTAAASIWVDSPLMDYFLIFAKSPAAIIEGYTLLTGRPPLVPKWAFGVWMSRCWYFERETVEAVVERMRSLGIPLDVINIDPAWLKDWPERRRPGCEFEWNERDFPDPEGFLRELRQKNVRVCLWENPYLPGESKLYEEGKKKGYLAKSADGSVAEPDQPTTWGMGIIDYTNPEAVEWIKEAHRRLLRQGVAAFKTDYGESVPGHAIFHNGMTGREMHNLYPVLYNRAAFEAVLEVHGEAILFGRSGGPGSQRYPIQWAGDSQSNFTGMAGSLKGGLSYALSGGAYWSHDIGGYMNPRNQEPPTPAVYIRWAQFGLLSPISRFHGTTPREPWEFGDEAVEIIRKFALLRSRLVPYLYSYAYQASQTGIPLMRPVYLEFPDDPHAPYEELEYFLGRELLVAPVFDESGKRTVYLPTGGWIDFWDGTEYKGPAFLKLDVPLDSMPVYVREDSILPLCREMQHTEQYPWAELTLDVYLREKAGFLLYDENKELIEFEAFKRDGEIKFTISPSKKTYRVILHGVRNLKGVNGEETVSDITWETRQEGAVVSFKTNGPARLRIIAE